MAHALAPDLLFRHLHAAMVADDVLITDALVLTAVTFPVLHGAENPLAEQAVTFRLVGTVVDGFGFQHLAVRTGKDGFRRSQTHCDTCEIAIYNIICCHISVILQAFINSRLCQTYP